VISNLLADVGYSARNLSKRPTFAAVVILTLAFGIGVNVAVFSLFEQILLRPLPVPAPDRLVNLTDPGPDYARRSSNESGNLDSVLSYPLFRDLERLQEPFTGIAAHRIFEASLSTGDQAREARGILVSGSYFPVLGLRPAAGRLLGPQDDRVDGEAESVVLSHEYWQAAFGSDPQVLGSTLIVNGKPLNVVGVGPPGFHGTTLGARASVFVPITFRWTDGPGSIPEHADRDYQWAYLFARLGPGVDRQQAEAAINQSYRAVLSEVDAQLLPNVDAQQREAFLTKKLVLAPGARGQSSALSSMGDRLALLFAASGVVLLLCCANVAGLMLVRGSTRSGEIAVRASLGATRARLAALLLCDSLLLTVPAAIASLPIAWLTLRGIASGMPGIPAAAFEVELDLDAALAAIGIAVSSVLVFGLFPAWGLMRTGPSAILQANGARQTSGKHVTRFRAVLATTQLGLSVALLAMTGTFAQSLANIARIELGLDVDALVTFSMSPQTSGYSAEARTRLFERLEQELAALPGVTSAASSSVPLLGFSVRGGDAAVGRGENVVRGATYVNVVSSGFFATVGMPLLAGREFGATDAATSPSVAIVNRRFAERFGLGQDAVGQHLTSSGAVDAEIVGVAGDAKYEGVRNEIEPQLFLPRGQSNAPGVASFYVRSSRPAADLMNAIRDTVAGVDRIVPINGLRTMRQQVRENLGVERFVAGASSTFAMLATLLAGLGLYGVLSFSVAQRAREIALRLALGARANGIRRMVLRQVVPMVVAGIVFGTIAAVMLSRLASGLLFGVEPGDPLALAGAAAVLAAVAVGAAYFPARRAAAIDPINALRYE
jgi:predicted permease